MSAMVTPAPVLSTPATSDWSIRFDSAQRRFRQSIRKPIVIEADPLPMLASPIDGTGDMQDPDFYQKFAWSPELSKRRLAVVAASVARINAELDEQAADAEPEVPAEDPAWDDAGTWELGPEVSFADELVAAVYRPRTKFHPSPTDHAWELGYSLGRDGIAAASHHRTHAETMAFLAGHDRGLTAYQDEQRDEVEAIIDAWEAIYSDEHELFYAGETA